MYAVYGLSENKETTEVFLGYIPATFFLDFTAPELWSVKTVKMPDGSVKIGRLFGKAFFVPASDLIANRKLVADYMGIDLDDEIV